ncbi:acyl carrier protein [Pseudomonas chlororaphis]|uniref:acyl carrier protein n=1 Tax=Pseudomonas chlororaphis TaxID=587753 RepID=UPI0004B72629|nr:acyl carrier protein [Pseudomonas chlororaphis]
MNLLIPSLGLDSVEIFELVGYLEDNSGVSIPESKIFSFKTIGELKTFMALD